MKERKAGHVVFGRYQLVRPLARGGMSSVWVATDRKLKREVAVKLMARSYAGSERSRQRFELEAMNVARLQSPHIVQIFDYGVDHHSPFIVMELLSGEDLRRRLKREHRLSLFSIARVLTQTALGLSEAHAVGVVHRDMKPGNLFMARSRSGELVKILDFGVAKAAGDGALSDEEITEQGTIVGTPQYMSPEQIRCLPDIDYRSDLFSLGVITYRMLTGELPFSGATPADLGVNICAGDFPPPSSRVPDLPAGIDGFMRIALATDPSARFPSARDLADAFVMLLPEGIAPLSDPSFEGPLSLSASERPMSYPPSGSWPTGSGPPTASGPLSLSGPPSGSLTTSSPDTPLASLSASSSLLEPSARLEPSTPAVQPSAPPGPLGASQSGTLVTAMLDDASLAERPSSGKKNLAIAAAIVVVLGAAGAVGTFLGSTAAQSSRGAPSAAPPEPAVPPPGESNIEEPDEPEEPTASASAAQASASAEASAAPPKPRPSPQVAPRPTPKSKTPEPKEDWDPFDSRK